MPTAKPSRSRPLLYGLLAAGSLVLAVQTVRRGNDFRTMWGAWQYALQGKDLYAPVLLPGGPGMPWRNPPFFTFATSPFGLLPIKASAFAWFYFKLGLLAWLAARLLRLSRRLGTERPAWLGLGLASLWFMMDFNLGHMNLVAACLASMSLVSYLEGEPFAPAVWLSLAACVKGPSIILAAFYAARREWKLVGSSLALCLFWTLLPALWWGPAKTLEFNLAFARSVRFGNIFSDVNNGWEDNWGLAELAMRAVGQALPANRYGQTLELAHLAPWIAAAAVQGLILVGLGLLALGPFHQPGGQPSRRFEWPLLHEAGIAATATLVLSPVTRKAHLCALVFPYFVLAGYLIESRRGRTDLPARLLAALSVALALLAQRDLVGGRAAFLFDRYHIVTFSLLALFVAQNLAARTASAGASR